MDFMPIHIKISDKSINPWDEVSQYQKKELSAGKYGALSLFVGTMRDLNLGNQVDSMQIEHYPEMTQKHLTDIATQLCKEYDIMDVLVIHRVGTINPGEPIVVIGVWSVHRKDALIVNHKLVEALKTTVPLWKKEFLLSGHQWVKINT